MRYVLDAHPEVQLVPQHPRLGGPGLDNNSSSQAAQAEVAAVCPIGSPGLSNSSSQAADSAAAAASSAEGESSAVQEGGRRKDCYLTPAEAALVQRFDPACTHLDTQGFFIAKFRKRPL